MQNSNVKTLLPIKQKDGRWIYPTELVKDEKEDDPEPTDESENEDDNEGKDNDNTANECKQFSEESLIHCIAKERAKLKSVKTKTGLLCSVITENPEANITGIKTLLEMLQKPSTKMVIYEKKMLILSLLHVFTDVLPTYKIRTTEEVDKKTKLKKETKKLLGYEVCLLKYYKKFIDMLQAMINDMKFRSKIGVYTPLQKKAIIEYGIAATKCLCDLLVNRYYFNYHKTLISIVVPLATNKNPVISEVCCKALENLYKVDKLGEASCEAVKQTVKLLKERQFCIKPRLLKTFLKLRLNEAIIDTKSKKADMKKIRKQMATLSRKEKKYKKKMHELEKQLRETETEESKETKSKIQTETLNKIFWIYFHVLKDNKKLTLISPVLEGLANFAHLINLEFFEDLSSVLCTLMESGTLNDTEKLYCMKTLFVILSGQAECLHIDPQRLYSYLYNIMLNLNHSCSVEQFQVALNCLDLMLMRRRKQLTQNRALAFIKRLSTAILQTPLHFSLAALNLVRSLMINTKSSDLLLDTESTVGGGLYMAELEDPEYCNASSTSLYELHALRHHYDAVVSTYAHHILNGCPFQGRQQLNDELLKLNPFEILEKYSESAVNITFVKCKRVVKRKRSRDIEPHSISSKKIKFDLRHKDVTNVDFCKMQTE